MWAWKHPHHDGTLTYTRLMGDVRFFDVNFGYTPEKTVLHNISLDAKPGQKLAFVGSTGAGKTTITNLINRFYDINDGKIRYDGINITKIKKPDLRQARAEDRLCGGHGRRENHHHQPDQPVSQLRKLLLSKLLPLQLKLLLLKSFSFLCPPCILCLLDVYKRQPLVLSFLGAT